MSVPVLGSALFHFLPLRKWCPFAIPCYIYFFLMTFMPVCIYAYRERKDIIVPNSGTVGWETWPWLILGSWCGTESGWWWLEPWNLIRLSRNSWEWKIIPTDELTHIFQRGRYTTNIHQPDVLFSVKTSIFDGPFSTHHFPVITWGEKTRVSGFMLGPIAAVYLACIPQV